MTRVHTEQAMTHRSVFHLDCTALFPDCALGCQRCREEIRSVLTRLPGVAGLYLEGDGADARLIVTHDPSQVTAEHLLDVFRGLPSFHAASFVPTLLG